MQARLCILSAKYMPRAPFGARGENIADGFYSVAADAEGETCAEADAAGEALGAGDGEGGAVVPGVSSERISPSCTVML